MNLSYQDFIATKRHSSQNYGIEPIWLPDQMFDFQRYGAEYNIRKGRCATFFDTGLGKTLLELVVAVNYLRHTNKPVLILTPLAVAFQHIKEAAKFGIDDIEYSRDGRFTKKIVVCNYERLDKFDPLDFDCVIVDESSAIKNEKGERRQQITNFLRKIKYRFLFTATPSPNDFIELGTSSEALGYMGFHDMLTKFFTNNEDTISPMNIGTQWVLKGHAKQAFFEWVSSWSISARKPSDIGDFADERYVLPKLIDKFHSVENTKNLVVNGQYQMFNMIAKRQSEVQAEGKATIEARCEKAAELVMRHDCSVIWCNLNPEGDLLEELIPNSVQVKGSDSLEKKEDAMQWFLGEKCICGNKNFRLNWQKKKSCGNLITHKTERGSIKKMPMSERSESLRVEMLMKIKSTCASIIELILKNFSEQPKRKRRKETESAESFIQKMRMLEKDLSNPQRNTESEILTRFLQKILESTELQLRTLKECSKDKMEVAPFAVQEFQEIQSQVDFMLTIAIKQDWSEDCFAHHVISELENSKTIQSYANQPQCTCGYSSGVRRLITKPKISGFGLNFQHCNHTVFFPTFSYEQYYQSIRRFWRFGQKREVYCDIVYSDGQGRVLQSILEKAKKANELFSHLNANLNKSFEVSKREFEQVVSLPKFLSA